MKAFEEILSLTQRYTLGQLKYIRKNVMDRIQACTNPKDKSNLKFHLANTEEAILIMSHKRKGIYNFSLRTKVQTSGVYKDVRLNAIKISDRYYINKNTDITFKGYTISYMNDEGYGLAVISYGPDINLKEVKEVAIYLSKVVPTITTKEDRYTVSEIITERRTSEVA